MKRGPIHWNVETGNVMIRPWLLAVSMALMFLAVIVAPIVLAFTILLR